MLRRAKSFIVFWVKSGMTSIRARPVAVPRRSTATITRAALRPLSWRLPLRPVWRPPNHVSSISTTPRNFSRSGTTIARRSLWSSSHAVL